MAIDKGVDSAVLDGFFGDIAQAIREKNGEDTQYAPAQMPGAIAALSSGGADACTVKTGSFVYSTATFTTAMEVGLSHVKYFMLYAYLDGEQTTASKVSSTHLNYIIIDYETGTASCKWGPTCYFGNMPHESFTITMDGGIITYTTEGPYLRFQPKMQYNWVAVGE